VPSGLIGDEDGMGTGRDRLGDLGQVHLHGSGVAEGQNQTCTLSFPWADRAGDVG